MVNKQTSRRGLQLLLGAAALLGLGGAFVVLGLPGAVIEDLPTVAGRPPGGLASENTQLPYDSAVSRPLALSATADDTEDANGLDDPYFAGVSKDSTLPFTIRGCVVDQDQQPLANAILQLEPDYITEALVARVRAAEARAGTDASAAVGPRTVVANEKGCFVFRTRRAVEGVQAWTCIYVVDPRCAPTPSWFQAARECDLGTIPVFAGAELHGRVVDELDRPIAAAAVRLSVDFEHMVGDLPGYTGNLPPGRETTTTDAAGWYGFGQLRPAPSASITIEAPNYRSVTAYVGPLEIGASVNVADIKTDEGLELDVIVVDDHDQPMSDALVVVCPTSSAKSLPDPIEGLTDPGLVLPSDCRRASKSGQGQYSVRGLENAEYVVAAAAPGRVGWKSGGMWPAAATTPITLRPRDPSATAVDLHVQDENGKEIDAQVSCRGPIVPIMRVETGHFRLDLATVRQTFMVVEATGFASQHVEVSVGTSPLPLVLSPDSRVRGAVIDDRGAAVGGACVSLRPISDEHTASTAVPCTLLANATGAFSAQGLAPGKWAVVGLADGYIDLGEGRQIETQTSEDELLTVTLTRCGAIAGHVPHPEETHRREKREGPPASVSLSIETSYGWSCEVALDPDGNFFFTRLAPGVYDVWYHGGQYGLGASGVAVKAGETTEIGSLQRLASEPLAPEPTRVIVFVHDGTGPVANARVEWKRKRSGDFEFADNTDGTGHAVFPCSADETIAVRALLPGGESTETESVELAPGEVGPVELAIGSARLSGTVINSLSGGPLPGTTLVLDSHEYRQADGRGAFEFPHVPTGEHWLYAKADGFVEEWAHLVLTTGEVKGQDIQLEPGGPIRVIVRAPNEIPIAATVMIWRVDAEQHDPAAWGTKLDCGVDGRADSVLPPGNYRLVAYPLGSQWRTVGWLEEHCGGARLVYLSPGNPQDVPLQLETPPD